MTRRFGRVQIMEALVPFCSLSWWNSIDPLTLVPFGSTASRDGFVATSAVADCMLIAPRKQLGHLRVLWASPANQV